MQMENTVYALNNTNAYDNFDTQSLLQQAINFPAKHWGLECLF